MVKEIKKVAIIGAGLIGAEWAAFFAGKGYSVNLYDIDKEACERGCKRAKGYLDFMKKHDIITIMEFNNAQHNIRCFDSIEKAVESVDFVQEAAAERYDVKKAIFKEVDRCTSEDVIVSSSSSALLMTEIQKVMLKPQRSIVAHPFNPAHLVPLVELVGGAMTDKNTLSWAKDFFDSLGKISIIVSKEIPGYIANRLQAAIWREAIDLVLKGVVTVEDIDKALYAGPGIRYSFMGQHLIYHLGGGSGGIEHFIDHIGKRKKNLWSDMASWTDLPTETKDVLSEGINDEVKGKSIAELEQWRDEKLVAILKVIYG